ncbi:protein-tyrosine phosphatase-like protein [Flagelloscypha sp. PMI_526]|nr:protein-tyrosine phosphatase-like protein [Flagelloscypha sp. PMI_526]
MGSLNAIIPGQLYLGDVGAASSSTIISQYNITHILSVCNEFGDSTGPKHLVVYVHDSHFENLLIELPRMNNFISKAIQENGCVLVHCQMGMSRSATCVIAYIMKTRELGLSEAIRFVKDCRPVIRPNDGFLRQLEVFEACACDPTPSHPAYISWKDTHDKAIREYKTKVVNIVPILPGQLYFSSGFPRLKDDAIALLDEHSITHLFTIAPSEAYETNVGDRVFCQISMANQQEKLLVSLPEAVEFLHEAIEKGGTVLVHSVVISRGAMVCISYFMKVKGMTKEEALEAVQGPIPLFTLTTYLKEHLDLYEETGFHPTRDHPAVVRWMKRNAD